MTIYQTHSQTFGSDSEPSPFQPSQQFATMMHHLSSEEHLPNGLGISQVPHVQADDNVTYGNNLSPNDQIQNFAWAQGLSDEMFDLEFNRRTLTQENFDAMHRDGGMINGAGQFESFDANFSGDHETMNRIFPTTFEIKQEQEQTPFGYPMVAPPLSSNDSTVPSVVSEHSMHTFPLSHSMQNHASMSASDSDWADSRSSSLASVQRVSMGAPMLPPQQPPQATTQWEPGSSVPVNVDAMKDEFQQVAAQASQVRASMDQSQAYEQPLAYPTDEAYPRRGSAASMLAQSFGSVGLHTPQPNQGDGVFKSPAPPASLAARRQRPKPANLSLRSQSYGGPGQPGSPGLQHNGPHGQSVRRVMSSNVLNGGVAQGRVMKSVPGSAQRSPLNWTFNDALHSQHLVRTVSHGNLAPPTPMSPSHPSQVQQVSNWQIGPNDLVQQSSISETEEQGHGGLPYQASGSVPRHVSPPHTPMYYHQQFAPQRVSHNFIMENTPPQSAPASQSCFPSNVFGGLPPQQAHSSHMAAMVNAQQQQYLNLAIPEQQYQVHNVTFAPNQHANVVSSGPPPGMPLTFATVVPVMRDDGNYQMSFPSQMQMMQPHQQTNSPPQMPYAFVNSNGGSPGIMSTSQPPKLATQPANDFVVHEYSPPDSLKRSVTPRKAMDSGPKNYSFTNAGPSDYEEKKYKRADAKESSSSPASSNGTVSTI